MKTINKNTLLKCGNKTYQPIEFGGMITWCDKDEGTIAQSELKIDGVPVISLDSYVERLAKETRDSINKVAYCCSGETEEDIFDSGFIISHKSNPNQYTQKDIEKAIELIINNKELHNKPITLKCIVLEQINSISLIEVDEQFNILSYE
jgi:hypothetical protein